MVLERGSRRGPRLPAQSFKCPASQQAAETVARRPAPGGGSLFLVHGIPDHVRSDNGPDFVTKAVRHWLTELGVAALVVKPASLWGAATSNRSTASSEMSS